MTYAKLVAADIYRDGGSLEARFQCDDGRFESLWLAAKPEDRSYEKFVHGRFMISADAESAENGRIVGKGTPEEEEILARLTAFMEAPHVDVPFSHQTPRDYYLQKVADLIAAIPNRKE